MNTIRSKIIVTTLLFVAALAWAGTAGAQLPIPPSTQWDVLGFLEEATLDGLGTGAHQGGHLKVNGFTVTVPAETIVIFPANATTWQEVFSKAPAPWGLTGAFNNGIAAPASGLAASDCANASLPCTAPPLAVAEVHVIGNRVGDQYIAGLIYISQQSLNSGQGFINFIDYTLGEMRVGGIIGDSTTGARVRLNDPLGRYGRTTTSPDVRFTVDPDNPTITAGTGYPMCLPRTAPAGGATTDTLCPEENRPRDGALNPLVNITTGNLTNPGFPVDTTFPNSTFQAPMEVGDYITYAGTLVKDAPAGGFVAGSGDGPTVGVWPVTGTLSTYIAAHTIESNVAIFTWPGSDPAYVRTDVALLGTGGLTVLGAGEATVRTRFEGMSTDTSRLVHLYGIDLDALGNPTDRDWGTIGVDPGPPSGAVKGRWRFRPPCLAFGTVPTKPDKQCVMNATNTFLPPTREMRAVVEGQQGQNPINPSAKTSANGLFYGQYHAPIMDFIFPENIPGSPIVENNFNTMPFLACGGYSSSGIGIPPTPPVLAAQLNPWPSNVVPPLTNCAGATAAPSAINATATPNSVFSGTGTVVTLNATSGGTTPLTFAWSQAATDVPQVTLTGANTATATFTTPVVAANTTLHFTVTVSNSAGSASAPVNVLIAVDQPIVNAIPAQTVSSGTPVTLNITGTDPGNLALTFAVTQTGGPAPTVPLVVTQVTPSSATATFTYTLPVGAPAATLTFNIVATNSAGISSAPQTTSVTVNPKADVVTIQTAVYRTSKQRLDLTASSSTVSPTVVLTLQPYLTTSGTIFDPTFLGATFTNIGAGSYTLTLVGAPEPAVPPALPLTAKSSLGGVSAPQGLTLIRQ